MFGLLLNWFIATRSRHAYADVLKYTYEAPIKTQQQLLQRLLTTAKDTTFGQQHGFGKIKNSTQFRQQVPITSYEAFYPWIARMLKGEPNVTWPEAIKWFVKTSGTTNAASKFIPLSKAAIYDCHVRAGQQLFSLYYHRKPKAKLFSGKLLAIGGSYELGELTPGIYTGDISGVLIKNLPAAFSLARTPKKRTVLTRDWDEKIKLMAKETLHQNVTGLVGTPTWLLVLFEEIFRLCGKKPDSLLDIWPNLELYLHGAINFAPYRHHFKQLIPKSDMVYMDCYDSSEGFFAVEDDPNEQGMLLLLNCGVFFEFLPIEDLNKPAALTHTLEEVELNKQYALVISTNAGLWRYMIGDTVIFHSKFPFRITVSGRTTQFLNACGEKLIVEQAEQALAAACQATNAEITDYTAGPIYHDMHHQRGAHQWLIEFQQAPNNLDQFTVVLDKTLQQLNDDYAAERQHNVSLSTPVITPLPQGVFLQWLREQGKLGGQHKVPRLVNDRSSIESILNFCSKRLPSALADQ